MRQNAKEKGSLTVEAILVLPLCMMVIVGLMTCFPLLRLQLQLQSVLVQTVQMQAVYAGTQEEGDASWLGAEGELLALCQKEQVDLDQVTAGMLGLHLFLDTEGNEVLHAILTYQFQLPFLSGRLGRVTCVQQCRCRIWNGTVYVENPDTEHLVYYTEYGTVYHTYLDCTYLKLSIHQIPVNQLPDARNEAGARYRACELCGKDAVKDGYYITTQGDCYHTRLTCPGLSRYIKTVELETVLEQGMRECSRCARRRE